MGRWRWRALGCAGGVAALAAACGGDGTAAGPRDAGVAGDAAQSTDGASGAAGSSGEAGTSGGGGTAGAAGSGGSAGTAGAAGSGGSGGSSGGCSTSVCTSPPVAAVPASCPTGSTFEAALGSECNTTCTAGGGCTYGTVALPCPGPGGGSSRLPQRWAYQVKLRQYLMSLAQGDFDVPSGGLGFNPNAAISDDDLYRLWIGAHYDTETGNLPAAWLLTKVPSSSFLLSSMESTSPPRVHPGANAASEAVGALFYGDWSYAGNPYYQAPGVLRRIFAITAADLMLMDEAVSSGNVNVDDASGALLNYGYVGARIKAEASLDPCVRAAYLVGLRRLFDAFEPRNVGNGNGDMLIAQPAGYAFMAEALADAPTRARAEAKASAQIDAICDPAGFCTHQGGGYDPYYEGWTQNHVSIAAKVAGWPQVVSFARAVHDLRAYSSLPQPEQVGDPWALAQPCLGPSAFSPATPWGACHFGGDYRYGRDATTADLTPDALYLVAGGLPGTPSFPTVAQMKADVASSRGLTRAWQFASDGATSLSPWTVRHYARGLSAGMMFYTPGTYAQRASALAATPELSKLPVLRTGNYLKLLGSSSGGHTPQLLAAKFGGAEPFSAVLHTGFIDTQYAGAGLGGGQLVAFWGKAQGSALLGWNIGRNYTFGETSPVRWLDWSNWTKWTAHVVSGRSGGTVFSSGRLEAPSVSYDLSTPNVALVTVSGDLRRPPAAQAALSGSVLYSRTFRVEAAGVTVHTSVAPSGAAPTVDELYELFPVFLRYAGETEPPSKVSFRTQGSATFSEAPLGVETPNVAAVRITRYGRTVELSFTAPRPMKLLLSDTPLPPNLGSLGYSSATLLVNLGASGGPLTSKSTEYTIKVQ